METKHVTSPALLLDFLLAAWPEVKRTKVKLWLKHGAVRVNDKAATRHDHPLREGDAVGIQPGKAPPPTPELPPGMKVLHEDAHLLVIHKPVGLLTVATEKEGTRTTYHVLTDYVRDRARSGQARIWIVHRLDRETSGLLVFAKTEEAKEYLQTHWQQMEKRYLALVEGAPTAAQGTLRAHLDESQPHQVYAHPNASAITREAVTHYRVLRSGMGRTLLELTLETGRRHQIRVQLSHAGCPIVGDVKYGAQTNPARRLGLHAAYLKITHPVGGQELVFESPLPPELLRLLPG